MSKMEPRMPTPSRPFAKIGLTAALTAGFAVIVSMTTALTAEAQQQGPKVVASIKPVHALVAQVMGTTGTPELLLTGNASPHTYALKPSDIAKVTGADVLFRISERLEPFTGKVKVHLPKKSGLVSLVEAKGVKTLPMRSGGDFEKHSHGKKGHAHSHSHDHGKKSGKAAIDGHIWLDPDNAIAMLDAIAEELAARMPANAATYRANAAAAKTEIQNLATELSATLAGLQDKPYIVFHDAYQYFENRFGLTVAGSITTDPEIPPSGKRLSELRAKIQRLGATCVFGEPNFDAKVVDTITSGTKARVGSLDPEGASLEAGTAFYGTLMRNLAKGVKDCLAPST